MLEVPWDMTLCAALLSSLLAPCLKYEPLWAPPSSLSCPHSISARVLSRTSVRTTWQWDLWGVGRTWIFYSKLYSGCLYSVQHRVGAEPAKYLLNAWGMNEDAHALLTKPSCSSHRPPFFICQYKATLCFSIQMHVMMAASQSNPLTLGGDLPALWPHNALTGISHCLHHTTL